MRWPSQPVDLNPAEGLFWTVFRVICRIINKKNQTCPGVAQHFNDVLYVGFSLNFLSYCIFIGTNKGTIKQNNTKI